MFFRFARGDMEALIFRPKVVLLFLRYFLYGYLFFLNLLYKSIFLTIMLIVLLVLYLFWSIQKNYHYVQNAKAIFYLPLLQLTADVAVASGSIIGLVKYMRLQTLLSTIKNNKSVTGLIIFYIVLMLSLINWGIPSNNHPFTYFMDEWHQLQAVRAVSAIANEGTLVTPTFLKIDQKNNPANISGQISLDPAYFQIVKEGMRLGVTEGTSQALHFPFVEIASKTGTAQLGLSKKLVNSWVVGFWPYKEPKYAYAVVMERGSKNNQFGAVLVMREFFDWLSIYSPEYLK